MLGTKREDVNKSLARGRPGDYSLYCRR